VPDVTPVFGSCLMFPLVIVAFAGIGVTRLALLALELHGQTGQQVGCPVSQTRGGVGPQLAPAICYLGGLFVDRGAGHGPACAAHRVAVLTHTG
jgi:hypothetical protein